MKRKPGDAFHSGLAVIILALGTSRGGAAAGPVDLSGTDYETPKLLTGTIYEKGPEPRQTLFKFRRTATHSNSTVRVLREYYPPEGSLVARERVVYEDH